MDEMEIETLLRGIEESCFVEYFEQFSDSSISRESLAAILHEERGYALHSSFSRVDKARRIVRAGAGRQALKMVIGSRNVHEDMKWQARRLIHDMEVEAICARFVED